MCVGGFRLGAFDRAEIETILADNVPPEKKLPNDGRIADSDMWMDDLVYRPVSEGIMKAAARLVSLASQDIVRTDAGNLVTLYELENGMIRLVSENDRFNYYKTFRVYINGRKIKKIVNGNDFPVQPLKLIMKGDVVRSNILGDEQLKDAIGFVIHLPPAGCSFVDLELE